MQVAENKMPDLNTATNFLEKILSRKCKIHGEFSCEYLHLKPSQLSPRLCCKCMEERIIPFSEAISIRLLLLATSNTTFNAYPKFSDSSITQKIQDLKGSKDITSTDLSSFFDSLHSAVSHAIEKEKNASIQKLASLSNSYQDVFNSLSQISKIEQFQEIVKKNNDNDDKLSEFIEVQYSQMNNYSEMISNKIQQYQMIQQSFSFTDANNKLREILRLIEGITLFPTIANNQQQSQQPLQQKQNLFEQPVQLQQPPIFLPSQQQHQDGQNQQLRESQQQKLQNQPSSSKSVYDYYQSLLAQCKVKYKNDCLLCLCLCCYDCNILIDYSYEEWLTLSEYQRQALLSKLKTELKISDRRILQDNIV